MSKYLPEWLKRATPPVGASLRVTKILKQANLHTVCQSAKCPNLLECFSKGTATFLILGDKCTRHCRFCAIPSHKNSTAGPGTLKNEPEEVARAARELRLKHIVITSVTRDDLTDGGSNKFAETINLVRQFCPGITIEVLTPDFNGNPDHIRAVADARPDVFNHNLETVPGLYPAIRPEANYRRSLDLLKYVKSIYPKMITKSGIMLGLGETKPEVLGVFADLRKVNCDMITIGQYLRPVLSSATVPVEKFITPGEFDGYRRIASGLGFKGVSSGPFVRSSYNAGETAGLTPSGTNKESVKSPPEADPRLPRARCLRHDAC
ncbi:MAG: lipoyl synthase [Planctomycetota bacterium]